MQILISAIDDASVSFFDTPLEDFVRIKNAYKAKLGEQKEYWSVEIRIGNLSIMYFANKEKCRDCDNFQEVPESEYCDECYDRIETQAAEDRARDKKEDHYDESRGH